MNKVFQTLSGTFALIPGLIVMSTNIGVPPDSSRLFFSATIEALGVFTLMILYFNKAELLKKSKKQINQRALIGVGLFLISLFVYLFLFNAFVEDVQNSSPVFFPLWAMGELKSGLAAYGSFAKLIQEWGRDDVEKVINQSSHLSLVSTRILFLFIYQLIFTSLTYAFGVLAVNINPADVAESKPEVPGGG